MGFIGGVIKGWDSRANKSVFEEKITILNLERK